MCRTDPYHGGVSDQQLTVVAVAAGTVAVLVLLLWWRSRRHLVRRLAAVTARLETDATPDLLGRGGLESSLLALERAASSGKSSVEAAQDAVDRLGDAFRLVGHGIVITDDDGQVVFRNE